MKHVVTGMGTPDYITAHTALDPDACAATRRIMEITGIAKTAGGLYADMAVWLFIHKSWQHPMRDAALIICHTDVHTYAPSIFAMYEIADRDLAIYAPLRSACTHDP